MLEFCNGKYTAKRDTHQWVLSEWRDGTDKNGNAKRYSRETYYGNLRQLCDEVIDREAGNCDSLVELRQMLELAGGYLTKQFEVQNDPTRTTS